MNLLILALLILITFLRGAKTYASIIGLTKCGYQDWLLIFAFLIICSIIVLFNTKRARRVYELKMKYNKGFCKSDIKLVR